MHKSEVLKKIRKVGLVPVLRADSEEEALAIAYALEAGGVTVLEVTMTVPGAIGERPLPKASAMNSKVNAIGKPTKMMLIMAISMRIPRIS